MVFLLIAVCIEQTCTKEKKEEEDICMYSSVCTYIENYVVLNGCTYVPMNEILFFSQIY